MSATASSATTVGQAIVVAVEPHPAFRHIPPCPSPPSGISPAPSSLSGAARAANLRSAPTRSASGSLATGSTRSRRDRSLGGAPPGLGRRVTPCSRRREVAHQVASDGTEKTVARTRIGGRRRVRADARRGPPHHLLSARKSAAAWVRVLCERHARLSAEPHRREILEQVARLDRLLPKGERITNVVVMGMGEPLANLPQCSRPSNRWKRRGGRDWARGGSRSRRSDCPREILELAELDRQYNLAVSLHAPRTRSATAW